MHDKIIELVSNIVAEVDYDIWKESYNTETSEDPEEVENNLESLASLVYEYLEEEKEGNS